MATKFRASYSGIGALIRSAEMQQAMLRMAERIKSKAESTAPVGDPKEDSHAGRYRDSFKVESGRDGGRNKDRAYGRVLNDSPEAFYVEYGSSKVAAHHTLLNAAHSVGE